MAYETLLVETDGPVGIITLNRPDALNALNSKLCSEVVDQLAAWENDAGIGCVIITGAGRAFAAGADIKEMAPQILHGRLQGRHVRGASSRRSRPSASPSSRP